ncbi:MAG: hypothetical protein KHY10_00425 [Gemella haemolysans]|uniref:hypothetical protein n=1 Tax=Gemella haemolysans TaxID=1379 RepID=UPI002064559C|nr:hypothetical protein [Gemella haemolysans]MBS5318147.1 hypothetical protein [Gemella haemolysans]DAS15887.1 MAG TPA: hypothetical protein [Caudoviricetes sp.]
MKLIVNANVLITNKDGILLLDEIIAKYGNDVENIEVNVEPIKDSPVQQNQLPTQQPVQTVQTIPVQTQTVQQTVPTQQPVQTVQTVPTQQIVQTVQTAVPVTEKAYTLEDLQRASSTLVQAGKIQLLQGLLQEFNSLALTTLPVEQYGAFALRLRELGAAI